MVALGGANLKKVVGTIMTDNVRDDEAQRAERRAFLKQCGRFGVVTPPVVTLMFTVSDKAKAQLLTSGKTTTVPIGSPPPMPTFPPPGVNPPPKVNLTPTDPTASLAMMIDSMGLMKL